MFFFVINQAQPPEISQNFPKPSKLSPTFAFSLNGTIHGVGNTQEDQHVYRFHKYNVWVGRS